MNNDFKIIIGSAKSFCLNNPININGAKPKYKEKAEKIYHSYIKKLSLNQTRKIYNLSEQKALEVFNVHKNYGQKFYYAIEMYSELVFKQLELLKYDREWVNKHLVIIDALYGIIKPYDLITPYRLDFKTKLGINLKKYWSREINKELKSFQIINLSSREFSSIIEHQMMEIPLGKSKQIKISRGKTLNKLLIHKKI